MNWALGIAAAIGVAMLLLPSLRRPAEKVQAGAASLAPLQRVGILLLILASILFAFAALGRDGVEDAYYRATHYNPYRWYDYAGIISLWIAPIGAVLSICYPFLVRLARWIRSG